MKCHHLSVRSQLEHPHTVQLRKLLDQIQVERFGPGPIREMAELSFSLPLLFMQQFEFCKRLQKCGGILDKKTFNLESFLEMFEAAQIVLPLPTVQCCEIGRKRIR